MGNFESNNYKSIDEYNILSENIDNSNKDIENISLIDNLKEKNKSLYSFDNIYLIHCKDCDDNKIFHNIYCKLKYYPDYICIKDSNKIYYTYSYYQIKSWGYNKINFILTTVNNFSLHFKYDKAIKCANKIKKICNDINKNNYNDIIKNN